MGEAEVGGGGAPGDKGPGEAATSPAEETVVWSPEVEVCLFHAMLGHKPVGVNRHFHMICIRDKFSQNIGRQVPSKVIWDHLSTMYDMQALEATGVSWPVCVGRTTAFSGRCSGMGPFFPLAACGACAHLSFPGLFANPDCAGFCRQKERRHESEILPFPNPERNFVLPEEIIQEVREGKVVIEEEMKEEMKEDVDPHGGADDGQPSLNAHLCWSCHWSLALEPRTSRGKGSRW
ncbi:MRG/MORF4L-binding protein isoform X2 [Sciurus carolinensis]|uniref:MRG/MORF4L-binding protein isoform X2 n=1 Tax=Sciurus carolinensis TaxID=30640 RepID=UPI001FB32DDF|nr:MRG/MORF4L-binding protein isoform X2 [Sciurus carolinensis]